MSRNFLSRLSLLIILGSVSFGCPGRGYLEHREEENKAECLSYGGTWTAEELCTPDFQTAIEGDWLSECTADPTTSTWSRIEIKFEGAAVHYAQLDYSSEVCDTVSQQTNFTSEYSAAREGTPSGRIMGQRRILTVQSLPPVFSDLDTVKLFDLNQISLLPRDIHLTRRPNSPEPSASVPSP
jgi:hypothetical protein